MFFSQFVIKAWATTDTSLIGTDDFCEMKRLDTLDGKYSCWHKHNAAEFGAVFDV